MHKQSRLLKTTRLLLSGAFFLTAVFTAIAVAFVLKLLLFMGHATVADSYAGMNGPSAIKMAKIWSVAGVAMSALTLFAVKSVLKIVDTAIADDPFAPENGARWERVGWLGLSVQLIEMATTAIVHWLMPEFRYPVSTPGVSWTGLFAILLIFVVAQIFKRGTEMRRDLDGTV